jgi:DNA polymerase-3 subunit delta
MKINIEQLKRHLPPKHNISLLSGNETLLLEEGCQHITHALGQSSNISRFYMDTSLDTEAFEAALFNASLLQSSTLSILRLTHWKLEKNIKDTLLQFSQGPSINHLIILAPKIEKKVQQQSWFKQLEAKSLWIPIWPVPANKLLAWIQSRAKTLNLSLNREQAALIASRTEGHLLATQQALTLLALSDATISIALIDTIIPPDNTYDIFLLCDFCLAGHHQKVLKIIRNLELKKVEPILLLWALAKDIRLLYTIQSSQQRIPSLETLNQSYGVWNKRTALVQKYLQRTSLAHTRALLAQLHQLDKLCKGAISGDIWQAFSQYCFAIAGKDLQ